MKARLALFQEWLRWCCRVRKNCNKKKLLTWVTRSSAWVRRSSAVVLSARSWTRSNSCDVVRVLRPKVVWGNMSKLLVQVNLTHFLLTPTCDRSSSPRKRSFSISKRWIFWFDVSQLSLRPISVAALSSSALDLPNSLCEHSSLLSRRSFSAKARCKRDVNLSTSLSKLWSFILYSAISRSCNSRSSIFSLSARSRCSLCFV